MHVCVNKTRSHQGTTRVYYLYSARSLTSDARNLPVLDQETGPNRIDPCTVCE